MGTKAVKPWSVPEVYTLSRAEIEDKALRLAAYRGGASEAEMRRVIALVWGMAENPGVPVFLP